MSPIPAFELGLWNAWTFILPQILVIVGSSIALDRRETYESKEEMVRHSGSEKRISRITFYLILFVTFYSIFFPLKPGTAWFYAAFFVYLLGTILLIMTSLAFATTAMNRPVTEEVHRVSRHPMNFGFFLTLVGTGQPAVHGFFCYAVLSSLP